MKYDLNYVVAVDFDNTITQGTTYGHTGTLNPEAKVAVERLRQLGCVLVLWTTRSGKDLEEALGLLDEWGIQFDYINEYPLRESGNKVNVDFYIDDKTQIGFKVDWNRTIDFIATQIKERK